MEAVGVKIILSFSFTKTNLLYFFFTIRIEKKIPEK